MTPTPLEIAILNEFYDAFKVGDFPPPDEIDVVSRENTGAGRFTELNCKVKTLLSQPCGPDIKIEMEGLRHGLGCLMFFEDGVPSSLELHIWGDDSWDGVERPWRIVPLKGPSHA